MLISQIMKTIFTENCDLIRIGRVWLVGLAIFMALVATTNAVEKAVPKNLGTTLDLYLSSDRSYASGNLITDSQLAEFQLYLRKTRGNSLATHSQWTERMVKDSDPLAQMFYNGGSKILSEVAQKVGGYAKLERLTRSAVGRKTLQQAIAANLAQPILTAIAEHDKKLVTQPSSTKKAADTLAVGTIVSKRAQARRIYTADDYVQAVVAAEQARSRPAATDTAAKAESIEEKDTKTAG